MNDFAAMKDGALVHVEPMSPVTAIEKRPLWPPKLTEAPIGVDVLCQCPNAQLAQKLISPYPGLV